MGNKFHSILPANPFMLYKGTPLRIINQREEIVGLIFLEQDTDITFGFSQKNATGVMIRYKTVSYSQGWHYVREELSSV